MPQVVMEKSASKMKPRRVVVMVCLVVVVMVGGSTAAWVILRKPATVAQNSKTTPGHYIGEIYVPPITENPAAIDQIKQEDYIQKSPKLLEQAKTGDVDQRADAYRQLALLALNAGKNDEALSYAKQGDELAKSHLSASVVARVAEGQGNKSLAVKYYSLAMSRAQASGDPSIQALYDNYKAMRDVAEKS